MKMANVVAVQDRDSLRSPSAKAVGRIDRMTTLLRRYPAIEDQERQEVLSFLSTGPQEEVVLVTHAEGLEPRVRAFRKDHPEAFPSGLKAWLPMIVFVVVAALGVAWRLLG